MELAFRVEYPARYRYKQINTTRVFVENVSDGTLDTVVVNRFPRLEIT